MPTSRVHTALLLRTVGSFTAAVLRCGPLARIKGIRRLVVLPDRKGVALTGGGGHWGGHLSRRSVTVAGCPARRVPPSPAQSGTGDCWPAA